MAKTDDLKVFISNRESKCDECGEELGRKAWITLDKDKGALCLSCADMDHLVFLPSGDAALTRRAKKHSKLSAVVLKWSRARKRYERQGLIVEEPALDRAEAECLADEELRESRRQREAERREYLDREYVKKFAGRIGELYPKCPKKTAMAVAEHACRKHSGRVGRSAAAKEFDEEAVRLAVRAHVRHEETPYDELLLKGFDRHSARMEVEDQVREVLDRWKGAVKHVDQKE